MDTKYWSKRELYYQIDTLKQQLGVSIHSLPINAIDLANFYIKNLSIEILSFPSNKICGILYKGNSTTSIALNANRDSEMQNFDCMHELIHYFIHDIRYCQRICSSEDGRDCCITQDSYIEWQANEGSAQFLVPYQDFIPKFSDILDNPPYKDCCIEAYLAEYYGVSPQVITFRLSSLSHEIDQYRTGTPLEQIELLSKRQQQRLGIQPTNYNALCDFSLDWNSMIVG